MAQTISQDRIVVESKGATSWKVHQEQRKKALVQLRKGKEPRNVGPLASSWTTSGRAFAISFFAAVQGARQSSLLHVDDPPFLFDDLFVDARVNESRRRHFVGVLEAARLFAFADDLRRGRPSEARQDSHTFTIEAQPETREGAQRFVGNFLPVQDVARQLRHPRMDLVESLRVYVGIDDRVLRELTANRLPQPTAQTELDAEGPTESILPATGWGLLPGRQPDSPPRGVYSVLNDGAFLAVELT
jgi:hypothetical protein